MGKQNFRKIYQDAYLNLGRRPTIKLSSYCDNYNSGKNYAGMIIYHHDGQYKWEAQPSVGKGIISSYRGQSMYVLIMCTDDWPSEAFRAAQRGRVHDYVYRKYFGAEYSEQRTCCAGFAVRHGLRVYSSVWLNSQSGNVRGLQWWSDGSKLVSPDERCVLDIAIDAWVAGRGKGSIVQIPDDLHMRLA